MSGISPTSGSTSSTPTISSVGQSLLTSGSAPNAVPATTVSSTASTTLSTYQQEYDTLNTEDAQELLYASFLSPSDSLANGNAVLQQAATLLGSPGHPGTGDTTYTPTLIDTSTTGDDVPSVTSILAASDEAAQKTLAAYAAAPEGSSILDYQA